MVTRIRIVLGWVMLAGLLAGCATNSWNYKAIPTGMTERKGVTVQVGDFVNNLGFADPNRVRFNVTLDRPVSQAMREAVIAELRQAGYEVASSDITVSGVIDWFGRDGKPAVVRFDILKGPRSQPLFSKVYSQKTLLGHIYDEEGQVETIRKLIWQFLSDPQAVQILWSGASPAELVQDPGKKESSAQTVKSSPAAPVMPPAPTSDVDTPPGVQAKSKPNAYAVVIGIESYREKLPKADFADRDAKLVADYLTKILGYAEENVVVRLNDRASRNDLEKYFGDWLRNNVEPGGSVFIYYSGHGAPNLKTGDAYLVPYDGDPTFVETTSFPLKRLYATLEKLPAKEVIVVLDSCFSGAGGRSVIAKGQRPMGIAVESSVLGTGKTVVLTASNGDQTSSTLEEKGHGLFTYYFLKGLQGPADANKDGTISLTELFDYVKPNVQRVARKQYNNEQTPQLVGGQKFRLVDR
jgi:hypothetical protein